ncbi:MAG: 2-C-methyl-D-erythritol 4-phosphate cytidylyltransferase [Thermoleophilaceae bacterium]
MLAGAGAGDRLGSQVPKAFVPCAGRPLWEWSADVLAQVCDELVFAVPPGHEDGAGPRRVSGGASRSESVRNALAVLGDADIVVVHDAARPLLTRELVERCIAEVDAGWDGAIAAARVTDTIKEADDGGRVIRTLDRARLWSIQTPQAFRAEVLRRALEDAGAGLADATDDAALVEAAGGSVRVVDAPPGNIKITWPSDLELAATRLC